MTLRKTRRLAAFATAALASLAGAQPATALVCGITPHMPGVIERTIAGNPPMGGEYDLIVVGVVSGIGPTDSDGYREVALEVGVVLRGTAPRNYAFAYPAVMDEPRPTFIRGATYLVAIESDGATGGPTTGPCSATKRVIDPEEIAEYISLAANPLVYREDLPMGVDEHPPAGAQPAAVPMIASVLALTIVSGLVWMFARRPTSRGR